MSEEVLEKKNQSDDIPKTTPDRISPSGMAALIICGIYFVPALAPVFSFFPLGFILGIGMWSASFLVIYIGIPLAFLIWAVLMGYRLFIRQKRHAAIWTGIKYGIIVFGVMGFVFWFWGMIPPAAKTFTLGYWIHAKVWVDVEEVRSWKQKHPTAKDLDAREEWPSSLRNMPMSYGRLYHEGPSTVTLVEGGGFGHWGVTIGPKGTPIPDGWCILKLEDGAWVWHEHQ